MKFVIAQMQHETNTFSPLPTPWESFGSHGGPLLGEAAYRGRKGTNMSMAAFIDIAEAEGAQVVTPIAAWANPSGPVDPLAYDRICDAICDAIAQGCDAILLDLHGAMVVRDRTDDGEGTLLERVRRLAPKTPLAVALDLHANVTPLMARNCDVLTGYKTYPHIDQYEAGKLAGTLLLRYMRGEIKPVIAWGNRPVLAQTLCMNTDESPMREFVDAAKRAEHSGLLAATAFGGFQMADFEHAGISVVTVADGDKTLAERACNEILDTAWQRKEDFIYRGTPMVEAIARAKRMADETGGPILLLDHADNCASGSQQDTMYVLREALAQGLTDIAVGPVLDPEAVATLIDAGVGAEVTLEIGGKMDMPAIDRCGEPLELTGIVRAITDGEYTITGPQFTGLRCSMGRTAVLDTGAVQIVVTERNQEPWDRGVFTSVGIDPTRKRFLLLKSRMYYRPVFLPIAKGAVFCDAPGVSSSDWTLFDYKKIRRPIYPLDSQLSEHR